jgi:hypothetical protein
VRFGGTLTAEGAFELGFDHIALAAGAGKPTVLDLPQGLARGVRTASDFLMALQLTGAARTESIANLQVRLPIVVVGGGLTAIDTATESLAYYPVQVEKFLARYEKLERRAQCRGRAQRVEHEETRVAEEFLTHALALRAEREAAALEGRAPRILELLQLWGGATIAYRKRLVDSPSYTLNHEEVEKALEEGIRFAEHLTPREVKVDEFGHARALVVGRRRPTHRARSSSTTSSCPRDDPHRSRNAAQHSPRARGPRHFVLDGRYFRAVDENGDPVTPERSAKPGEVRVLMSKDSNGRFTSFFGDLHPSFFGNVVKAMGSAKQGYPVVSRSSSACLPAGRPRTRVSSRGWTRSCARPCMPCTASHPRSSRSWCTRRWRHGASSRAVLPPAELRDARGAPRRHPARHGGPGPDRRVGGP